MIDRARGIDVNAYHPVTDFAALATADLSFVGVKATEGHTVTDPKLVQHRNGLRGLPLDLVIYYHFARSGDPVAQAARLLNVVGPLKPNERVCLDLEVLPDNPGNVLGWIDAFYGRVQRAYPATKQLIYTSKRIWDSFGSPAWPRAARGDVALWAPRYNASGNEPMLPSPWAFWTIWQWTDGGEHGPDFSVPGVGSCDANVWNGDRAAVQAWVGAR